MGLLLIFSLSHDQLTHKKKYLLSSPLNTPSLVSFYSLISLTRAISRQKISKTEGLRETLLVWFMHEGVQHLILKCPPSLIFTYSSSGQLEWHVILLSGLWNPSDFIATNVEMTVATPL